MKAGRLIDMHSHWGTKRGYALRTPEELALQIKTWRSEPKFDTEEEMVQYFRDNNCRTILDLGFTKYIPLDEVRDAHDYAFETQRRFPDVIIGNWIHIDPTTGPAGVTEFKRCLDANAGFVGLAVSGGHPANDEAWTPYYRLCMEYKAPALIFVGMTGLGANLRGGRGIRLETCHPRYLDDVAAEYADLTIIAARPAWPWQDEMIAVMLHKANVWCELHGWRPKHHTPALKHDIARRLQDRVMFGADYPMFRYEQLVGDWMAENYKPEILDKVFYQNAERFFKELAAS